jgi:hypothetical protein
MASLTAERGPAVQIAKQYRVRYRSDNGCVTYESLNDTEGSELLTVAPDGSLFSHVIVGLCGPCAFGDGCGLGDDCPGEKSRARDAMLCASGDGCGLSENE